MYYVRHYKGIKTVSFNWKLWYENQLYANTNAVIEVINVQSYEYKLNIILIDP